MVLSYFMQAHHITKLNIPQVGNCCCAVGNQVLKYKLSFSNHRRHMFCVGEKSPSILVAILSQNVMIKERRKQHKGEMLSVCEIHVIDLITYTSVM